MPAKTSRAIEPFSPRRGPSGRFVRRPERVLALVLLLITGCASLPQSFHQTPSAAWPAPEETALGALVAEVAPDDPTLSGVQLLRQPEPAFKARMALAMLAEKTLDMQYYLWKEDLSGQVLMREALLAADRGVKVRFLIDDIYHSGRDRVYALLDAHPNLEVRVFNPIANRGLGRYASVLANGRLNHRMHNKIFLADSAVAVLGGRNIGNDYFGIDTEANFFDLDVLTTGRGAREAGQAFDEYWNSRLAVPIGVLYDTPFTQADVRAARQRFEDAIGRLGAIPYPMDLGREENRINLLRWRDQLIWASADVVVDPLQRFEGQGESAIVEFTRSIEAVDESFMLESAYLIPSEQGLASIKAMVDAGVRVRVLTNSLLSNNPLSAHSGYLKYRKKILRTGAELHELRPDAALREHFQAVDEDSEPPAGIHTKAFVLDGRQALIGSFNFDPRSRDLNSEIGLVVTDREFAGQVEAAMLEDFDAANSYRLFLDEQGRLRWEEKDGGVTRIHTHDPGASIWQRMGARILSWLPIEQNL